MKTYTLDFKFGALLLLLALSLLSAAPALAANTVTVDEDVNTCEPTVISAYADNPPLSVTNQYLVVDTDDEAEQYGVIPADGTPIELSVGPFSEDTTVSWHVFGGAERDLDMPLWNGYGEPGFGSDIGDYATEVGSFSWVIAGTDDPNPFVTWFEVEVPACAPVTTDDCKKGGWEAYGFKNQGQCVASLVSQSANH